MKKTRIIIWILVGSCILNLIFAINAGQKRKDAVLRSDSLDAKLAELELRYKNAIQSYDASQKELDETKRDLAQQQVFSDTLKETLQNEQKKAAAIQAELDKLTSAARASKAKSAATVAPKPQEKKIDRTTRKW